MTRFALLFVGVAAYAIFFVTFLYLVAFVGNLPGVFPALAAFVPRTVDAGGAATPAALAVALDLALVLAFGLQHSVMARMGFKAWLTQRLPRAAERSVYVLLASAMLILLFWQWRPLPAILWSVSAPAAVALAWTVFAAGFGLVLLSTFLIDHFDLFGLRQTWTQFRGGQERAHRFVTPLFYRVVRHPLYLGFLLAFWAAPTMTAGHALFAAAMSAYILVAIGFEERDLIRTLGDRYTAYRSRVPMLVPRLTPYRD